MWDLEIIANENWLRVGELLCKYMESKWYSAIASDWKSPYEMSNNEFLNEIERYVSLN